MYYKFDLWIKEIYSFLNLDNYIEAYNFFKNEFSNSTSEHKITNNRIHHRSGHSKQYLSELKKDTITKLIDKLSNSIKCNIEF